jgi:hypothetical protein
MSGPFRVRIAQADGVARELGVLGGRHVLWDRSRGTAYKSINSARRAARQYIGDGKHLGQHYADITDDNDHERLIEL